MAKANPIKPVSLTELVQDVARQLRELKKQQPPPGEAVIGFKECEVELSVGATVEVGGGIKFWVLEVSGKGSTSATHKIKLTFSALGAGIQAVQVVDAQDRPAVEDLKVVKR